MDKIWDVDNLLQLQKNNHKVNLISIAHRVSENLFCEYFKLNAKGKTSYSGGIAQNTIINSQIKQKYQDIYIPPHCADEGLSLGCIEFLRKEFQQEKFDTTGFPFWQSDESPETRPSKETIKKIAEHLASGKIVGWYQGNGEVGPRALGNRSILMNPMIKNGKEILNNQVKHREWFRPFGASILEEYTSQYFDWLEPSPYMLYVMDILDKESFPAITHVDGTCRIQTVSQDLEDYYSLIEEFRKLTGIPMLLNTSLNVNGKPIAGHMSDLKDINVDIKAIGNQIS
jgi:carbamoyltransferase